MSASPRTQSDENWTSFYVNRRDPMPWPNEPMLKTLFGSYLSVPRKPKSGDRVLDVGCGLGQNLLPFAVIGCDAFGIELTQDMADLAKVKLGSRGVSAEIKEGRNRAIPFPDNSFDYVLSVNTLHYESAPGSYAEAIREFYRVLKPGGMLYISTVGPLHEIRTRAEPLGGKLFRIANFDFRNGETMMFLDSPSELAEYLRHSFRMVEVGHNTEQLMTRTLDFLIAAATK